MNRRLGPARPETPPRGGLVLAWRTLARHAKVTIPSSDRPGGTPRSDQGMRLARAQARAGLQQGGQHLPGRSKVPCQPTATAHQPDPRVARGRLERTSGRAGRGRHQGLAWRWSRETYARGKRRGDDGGTLGRMLVERGHFVQVGVRSWPCPTSTASASTACHRGSDAGRSPGTRLRRRTILRERSREASRVARDGAASPAA